LDKNEWGIAKPKQRQNLVIKSLCCNWKRCQC